jgi:hypothetical protein
MDVNVYLYTTSGESYSWNIAIIVAMFKCVKSFKQSLVLYGQATKRTRWMPRQLEAMKDVGACEKSRGAGKHALIRECPNGETH